MCLDISNAGYGVIDADLRLAATEDGAWDKTSIDTPDGRSTFSCFKGPTLTLESTQHTKTDKRNAENHDGYMDETRHPRRMNSTDLIQATAPCRSPAPTLIDHDPEEIIGQG